jgi:hypothetical protein
VLALGKWERQLGRQWSQELREKKTDDTVPAAPAVAITNSTWPIPSFCTMSRSSIGPKAQTARRDMQDYLGLQQPLPVLEPPVTVATMHVSCTTQVQTIHVENWENYYYPVYAHFVPLSL